MKVERRTRVIILGIDDEFVHVYRDAAEMLKANDIGFGPDAQPFPIELFNDRGQPLAGVYDREWRVTDLMAHGTADPERLRLRLIRAVENLRRSFRDSADRLALYGKTPEDVLAELDEMLPGRPSLEELLTLFEFDHDALAAVPQGDLHDHGFWHNWLRH